MLTTEQRNELIVKLLNEGKSLSEVQKALEQEGAAMTYFDLRLLAADLEINWKRQDPIPPPPPEKKKTAAKKKQPGVGDDVELDAEMLPGNDFEDAADAASGGTHIEVSKIVRPGAAISGSVTFASGAHGEWYVDNAGRLGVLPGKDSAKPTQEDVMAFQTELQRLAQSGQLM